MMTGSVRKDAHGGIIRLDIQNGFGESSATRTEIFNEEQARQRLGAGQHADAAVALLHCPPAKRP